MEKAEISKGLSESDLAGSSEFGVNDAGTCEKGDTRLTQPRSLDVHAVRKSLNAMRAKHGADTPIGHRCSNLIEIFGNLPNATGEAKAMLEKSLSHAVADLARLSSAVTPNAEDR